MRILKLIAIFIIITSLTCCTRTLKGKVEQVYKDGTPQLVSYYSVDTPKILVKQKWFYPNKQLRMEGYFKDGEKNGKWIYYYEDGTLWSKGYFKNGKIDGYNETYYPNGKLNNKGSFTEGIRVGKWIFYDENGTFEKEINYDE